jgi:hypothetical protein
MTGRIRMSHRYGETPENIFTDFDWIRLHEEELLAKYGERSIIVYQQQVIGVGDTYDEAVADAEHNLQPDVKEVTPVHEFLHHRQMVFRFTPKSDS